jgi:Hydrophobic surface binding protein A
MSRYDSLESRLLALLLFIRINSPKKRFRKMIFTRVLSVLILVFSVTADFDTFQDVYAAISDSMQTLDQAILNITSDSSTISALTPVANAVTDTIQNGIKAISAEPPLPSTDMILFMVTSKLHEDAVVLVVTDLEDKKSDIEGAKGRSAVLDIVKKLRDVNKEFVGVVLTKIPSDTKTLVQDQSSDVLSSWDRCVKLFEG